MSWINYRNWSLRKRLVLLIASIALAFMLTTTLLLDALSLPREQATVKQQSEMVHQFLTNDLAELLLTGNPDVAVSFVEKLTMLSELKGIWVYDLKDNAIFRSGELTTDFRGLESSATSAFMHGEFWLSSDVVLSGQLLGKAVYFYQREPLTQRLFNNLIADLWLIPIMLLMAIPLAQRVARNFLQPFDSLVIAMNRPEAETGILQLDIGDESDEVKQLYRGFNKLEQIGRAHV